MKVQYEVKNVKTVLGCTILATYLIHLDRALSKFASYSGAPKR